MDNKTVTLTANPDIDFLFGLFGGRPIPTKQDKFAPIEVISIDEQGNETLLNNFYIKNPKAEDIDGISKKLKEAANDVFKGGIIKKPNHIEVIISISITEKRFKEVDVDNLAKYVLDSLNGIAYEDDSQVVSLICKKHIHPMKMNGIMIGITKLSEIRKGVLKDLYLYKAKNNEKI